jgi:hypothetical protein
MAREYLRVYQEFDIEEVKKHLLILGDLSADCAACRMLGIDGYTAKHCPQCQTEFKYLTSRRIETHPGERFQIVRRMREKRPDLIFLDYTDFSKTLGQKKARDFFA